MTIDVEPLIKEIARLREERDKMEEELKVLRERLLLLEREQENKQKRGQW